MYSFIDNLIYALQKSLRKGQTKKIQRLLDNEHARRDYQNKIHKTCYTTKQALMLETPNNI